MQKTCALLCHFSGRGVGKTHPDPKSGLGRPSPSRAPGFREHVRLAKAFA
jgi:hypothetical protein